MSEKIKALPPHGSICFCPKCDYHAGSPIDLGRISTKYCEKAYKASDFPDLDNLAHQLYNRESWQETNPNECCIKIGKWVADKIVEALGRKKYYPHYPEIPEHLLRTCPECQYTWREACIDSKEESE